MPLEIAAILFDADGVLQHATTDLEARLEGALGFVPEPLDDFTRQVFAAERPALIGEGDFLEALDAVLDAWGTRGRAEALLRAWWHSVDVDREVIALVGQLRAAGYRCALATNQQRHRAEHMRGPLGYDRVFDHSFYSCDLGVAKPDTRYFEAITRTLKLEPERLLFLDDHEHNVDGARETGLHAARFVHGRRPEAAGELRQLLQDFAIRI